ncbi:MAG: GTPase Era [Chitinophagaceae bacterium]|nr:MAG: GTPase Era [Chitinophagaceae bacterium]
MKAGFVNIFGKPNAGKSTLLNALVGEKLAIVSPKVQTTRHRIKGILTTEAYQIILSDTPGIIAETRYKLHDRMMGAVKSALEDADVAVLLVDVNDNLEENDTLFSALKLRVPCVLVLNKVDKAKKDTLDNAIAFFKDKPYAKRVVTLSALTQNGVPVLLDSVAELLPEGEPFFAEDELTDLPEKFFVAELVRERIFQHLQDEIPYEATVLVQEFKHKSSLIKIGAIIVVQRESQKAIILGEGGKMIKRIGSEARAEIEKFLQSKVFLELFVKVRPKWRENDLLLREYGY